MKQKAYQNTRISESRVSDYQYISNKSDTLGCWYPAYRRPDARIRFRDGLKLVWEAGKNTARIGSIFWNFAFGIGISPVRGMGV